MTEPQKPRRGRADATKRAESYFQKHPNASAGELSRKFKIAITTVRRADWWKNRAKEQANG